MYRLFVGYILFCIYVSITAIIFIEFYIYIYFRQRTDQRKSKNKKQTILHEEKNRTPSTYK